MVRDEITDGTRIGRLLSSEIHGHERGALGRLSVVEARPDVEPTEFGAFAYGIELDGGTGERLADVHLHPDRIHLAFRLAPDLAAEAGREAGLRVRPKAVDPPQTLAFVENGAAVKAALRVVRAVAEARLEEGG